MIKTPRALALVLCAFSGPALAGGLIQTFPEEPFVEGTTPGPVGFAGAYAGISLGYASGNDEVGVSGPTISGKDKIGDFDSDGTSFGVQFGYRWDLASMLLGVEAAATGGTISADFDNSDGNGETSVDYALSLRASAGTEIARETLVYGFAGASYAQFDYDVARDAGGDISEEFSRIGYLGGIGLERAIGERWLVRGEYQYTNYGSEDLTDSSGYATKATPDYHSFTVGLNYRFGQ
ncbi:outer membrane beta-barrel protein [Tropicimonas sp. TH_r6]|uniref:outer membrane protein n=1 Tax=Tropicimonas sp. TH_r6 TaxID=3082085 RepID=UPI002952E0C8|nr:outer membrane beta-barrel protein [Tropicimonas sp. TH_r6]MDV7142497.1 outer membrane beta-barrel protein [Tropicimonas sp. TH_r6]